METILSKNCPKCGKLQNYLSQKGLDCAIKKNSVCKSCIKIGVGLGKKFTEDHKNKLSDSHKGKQCGVNNGMYGKKFHHTEETKKKIGLFSKIRVIERKEKMGILKIGYNPKACNFIDKLNKQNGWNLQHAENGGEIRCQNYFLDGYDKLKNIVFEYDEPHHHKPHKQKQDKLKQEIIIKEINPSKFIRYDELNNNLYNVFIG